MIGNLVEGLDSWSQSSAQTACKEIQNDHLDFLLII